MDIIFSPASILLVCNNFCISLDADDSLKLMIGQRFVCK